MNLRAGLLFIAGLACVATTGGAEPRHLGAHVHGQASVGVSIDGPVMDVTLSLPGHDAAGFEHPPGSAEETKALAHARQLLQSGRWLEAPREAACRLERANVVAHGFDAAPEAGGHADFDVDYRFHCAQPDKLDAVIVRLVEAFPSVQTVTVDVISAAGSHRQVLERGVVRVDIAP